MSIDGIRGPSANGRPGAVSPPRPDDGTSAGTLPTRPRQTGVVAPSRREPPQVGASQSVPAQPPPGTDPALWTVLTQDERTYFAKLGAMGPLTYGRVLSGHLPPSTPHVVGGRLDVKA